MFVSSSCSLLCVFLLTRLLAPLSSPPRPGPHPQRIEAEEKQRIEAEEKQRIEAEKKQLIEAEKKQLIEAEKKRHIEKQRIEAEKKQLIEAETKQPEGASGEKGTREQERKKGTEERRKAEQTADQVARVERMVVEKRRQDAQTAEEKERKEEEALRVARIEEENVKEMERAAGIRRMMQEQNIPIPPGSLSPPPNAHSNPPLSKREAKVRRERPERRGGDDGRGSRREAPTTNAAQAWRRAAREQGHEQSVAESARDRNVRRPDKDDGRSGHRQVRTSQPSRVCMSRY